MGGLHSEFPPSSGGRMIACPASWGRSRGIEVVETEVMREGTLAHSVLENLCYDRFTRDEWILPEGYLLENVTQEMVDAVNQAYTIVEELRGTNGEYSAMEQVEAQVNLSHYGLPEVWGTADYSRAIPLDTLTIMDYKHGIGVPVMPDCAQLRIYAAAAAGKHILNYEKIELIVCQPRCPKTVMDNRFYTTGEELNNWVLDVYKPAIEDARSSNPTVNPGEEQCRWCPAKLECPEFNGHALTVAQMDYHDIVSKPAEAPAIPTDVKELEWIFRNLPILKSWIKEIEKEVLTRTKRREMPGLKLIAGRGRREWKSESAAIEFMRNTMKMDDDRVFIKTVRSVAQTELLATRDQFSMMRPYIQRYRGKPKVVGVEDKRKALDQAYDDYADRMRMEGP